MTIQNHKKMHRKTKQTKALNRLDFPQSTKNKAEAFSETGIKSLFGFAGYDRSLLRLVGSISEQGRGVNTTCRLSTWLVDHCMSDVVHYIESMAFDGTNPFFNSRLVLDKNGLNHSSVNFFCTIQLGIHDE